MVVELLLLGCLAENGRVLGGRLFLTLHLLAHLLHPVVGIICLIYKLALLVLSVGQTGVLSCSSLLLLLGDLSLRISRLYYSP